MKKVNLGKKLFSMANALVRGTRPKRYKAKFMAPGLTNYPGEDGNGDEAWYISRETMNEMQESFVGCPVVAQERHDGSSVPDNFDERIKRGDYDGVVTDAWTDPDDGWDWCSFIVWNPDVQELIEAKGWNVSCAYNTLEDLPGGVLNAIKYDHEVAKGEYIHMAIVDSPRQTGAKIMMNSIDTEDGDVIIFNMSGKDYKLFPRGKVMTNENDKKNVSPPGMEKTVEEMKKHPEIDNPFALAWWMKEQGYKGSEDEDVKDAWEKFSAANKANEVPKKEKLNYIGESDIKGKPRKVFNDSATDTAYYEDEGGKLVKLNAIDLIKGKKEDDMKKNKDGIDLEKAVIETPTGDVPLKEMINAYEEKKKADTKKNQGGKGGDEDKDKDKKLSMDDEIDGVKVKDMYDAYKAAKAKKSQEDDEDKKKKEDEEKLASRKSALKSEGKSDEEIEDILKSESEEEKKKEELKSAEEETADAEKKAEEKRNHFNSLKNARKKSEVDTGELPKTPRIMTRQAKINAAKQEY